jgi:hypothetical protein
MTLDISTSGTLPMTLQSLIGESIAVLGIKGSGKTNTAAVLIEELLAHGLPLTIVDIEGEYWGLKERFDVVVVGQSANVDIPITTAHAGAFAEYSMTQGVSLILDLSGFDSDEAMAFLLAYFNTLWEVASRLRRPYQVVLEEAHEFVPQGVRSPLKTTLARIALRGRKRGLGMVLISQRSAKVEKDVLTQAAIVFLHRVVHPIDMKIYQEILPLPSKEVEGRVGALGKGDALVLFDHVVYTVHVRLRHTYHAGATPEMDAAGRSAIPVSDSSRLAELRRLVTEVSDSVPATEAGEVQHLKAQIAEKERLLASQAEELRLLREQVALLNQVSEKAAKGGTERTASPTLPGSPLPKGTQSREQAILSRQQSRFNALVRDVRLMRRWWRDLLVYLMEREGTTFSIKQIKKALVISETTLKNVPPLELIRMGLIRRNGSTVRDFTYTASVRKQFAEMFPDLDTETLVQTLLKQIRS